MILHALSSGYAVPRNDFEALTHSVFKSAVNIRLVRTGRLLTLTTSSESDLPQGIRVETPAGFSYESLRIGAQVCCRDHILTFEDSPQVIDLSVARRWKCNLPALNGDMANQASVAAWNFVWQMLTDRQERLGAEIRASSLLDSKEEEKSFLTRRAGSAITALAAATARYNSDELSSVKELIGLGPGLTPAGDDLLVGYLAGLWCTVRSEETRKRFLDDLGRMVIRFSRRTNDISRTYLYHAAHGQVSRRLESLARLICQGIVPGELRESADLAMQTGHTSGMDTVTGLLIGLQVWNDKLLQSAWRDLHES